MLSAIEFELRFYAADAKTRIGTIRTSERGGDVRVDEPGGTLEFAIESLPLKPGAYYLGALVRDLATGKTLAWWDGETRLHVTDGSTRATEQHIPHTWRQVHADAGDRTPAVSVRSRPAG
jgi:hypothetical protein